MSFASFFLPLAAVWTVVVVSPGPDFIVTLKNSLVYSRKKGVWTGLGVGTGIVVHLTYCLLGIALIISQSLLLFSALKIGGALYIIFLGIRSFYEKDSSLSIKKKKSQEDISALKAFRMGFLSNVLNPKVTLFLLSIFTVNVTADTPLLYQFIAATFISGTTFIWYVLIAFLFSIPQLKEKYERFSHAIHRVFGVLLVALGLRIAFQD